MVDFLLEFEYDSYDEFREKVREELWLGNKYIKNRKVRNDFIIDEVSKILYEDYKLKLVNS